VGAGHVPTFHHDELHQLVDRGIHVVLASRSADVDRSHDSHEPFLRAGDLTSEKAALALMVGLGAGQSVREWWRRLMLGAD
jgi:L-asparaginase/Glu-tRNA(Gln) amidotransferase subunit D